VKICLVSPYDMSKPGGVTEHIRHLGVELRRRGATVKLLAPSAGDLPEELHADIPPQDFYPIGRPIPIPANGSIARITLSFHLARYASRVLEKERFDIVHIHEPLAPALPIGVLRASKTCNVGTFHAYAQSSYAYYYARRLVRRYHRKLHGLIAVSPPARDFVQRYFPADYRIVPNGVDLHRFAGPVPPLPQLRDGMVNILFVGRLEKRKGLGNLLRAYVQLKEHLPQLRLIVVGEGRLRAGYERWIARNQVPDIVMAGYVSPDELPRYHASAHIFCAPNTGKESFGIVLLEAMAAGLPVVATDIPGFSSVITPGREGLLVRKGDAYSLASALHLLAVDPGLRHRLAIAGRATAAEHDWNHVVDRVVRVYDDSLRAFHPSRPPWELLDAWLRPAPTMAEARKEQ
jgi:phosphatidylinositol alpha-mannosyltransferase